MSELLLLKLMRLMAIMVQLTLINACGSEGKALPDDNCTPSKTVSMEAIIAKASSAQSIEGSLDDELQRQLEKTATRFIQQVPGVSVGVAIPNVGHWVYHGGISNSATGAAIDQNALFQIASITKPFIATIIMQLISERKLNLQDTIADWYPNTPDSNRITINHLLRHTSGLTSFNTLEPFGKHYQPPNQLIKLVETKPLLFSPGSCWAYSNTGYVILGQIIEEIEGMPLEMVLENRVTNKIGLSNTLLRQPNDMTNVVSGHESGIPVITEDGYATPYAAGSLASTASDLLFFWHGLLSGQLTEKMYVIEMFSSAYSMSNSGELFYGSGVQIYDVADGPGLMLGHSGGITGFTSVIAYIPEDDIYVSVIFNDRSTPAEAGLWSIVQTIRSYRN